MKNTMLLYGHLADKELVDKVKGGQAKCFEVLVRLHTKALYRIARTHGLSHTEAEEVMLTTHLEAFSPSRKFIGNVSYRTWLMKLMINNCLKFPKTIAIHIPQAAEEPACSPVRSAHHYDSSRLPLITATAGKFEACLEQLPLTLRSVYILCEVEGYSIPEGAHLLSTTEETIKTHLDQAKSSLRKTLRTWYQYTDIYPYDTHSGERIVHQVMNRIDAKSDIPVGVPAF